MKHRLAFLSGSAALVCAALGLASSAHAAVCDTSWAVPVDGSWINPAAWTNGVPDSTKRACITFAGTYTVTVVGAQSAAGITLGGPTGTQTLQILGDGTAAADGVLTLANQSAGAEGVLANGVLSLGSNHVNYYSMVQIQAGALINAGTIRTLPGGYARRFLHGDLVNTGTLDIQSETYGREDWTSSGTITVAAGVIFSLAPLSGGVFTWSGGTIQNGGTFDIGGGGFTALAGQASGNAIQVREVDNFQPSGTGSAVFRIVGSLNTLMSDVGAGYTLALTSDVDNLSILNLWADRTNAGTITLGSTNVTYPCQLKIWSGALTNNGTIRSVSGGYFKRDIMGDVVNNGTIEIKKRTETSNGSDWTNNGTISVDPFVTLQLVSGSTLSNQSGSTLSGGTYVIGGTLRYPGANVQTNAATVVLDGSGNGAILNESTAGDAISALASNAAAGSLTLLNGRALATSGPLSNAGAVTIDSASDLTVSGNYTQSSGSTRVDGALTASGGQVQLNGGTLTGSGAVSPAVTNGATVGPGSSPGVLSLSGSPGSYAQTSSGAVAMEIHGPTPGSGHDQLAVSGAAALGGTLDVTTSGFTPTAGQSFVVLTAASVTGTFATVHFTGPTYDVRYNPTNVTLVFGGATAVRVAQFRAARVQGGVSLRWLTFSEAGVLGFNLYRGSVRLNGRLVGARGSLGGAVYSWRGASRTIKRSTYRLQVVLVNGSRIWVGSARA